MGNKYGATVVHQGSSQRDESVVSWASRSSHGYQSPGSDYSSEPDYVFDQTYRDPGASKDHTVVPARRSETNPRMTDGNMKKSTERSSKKKGKVVVLNHGKGSKDSSDPSPGYSGGYHGSKHNDGR